MIPYCNKLEVSNASEITYDALYDTINNNYFAGNGDNNRGCTMYEFFTVDKEVDTFVKPFFDYEEYFSEYRRGIEAECKAKFFKTANKVFGTTDDDWAVSAAHRYVWNSKRKSRIVPGIPDDIAWVSRTNSSGKRVKQCKEYKVSFHFICHKFKVNAYDFTMAMRDKGVQMQFKLEDNAKAIDFAVYRTGKNKFRFAGCLKNPTDPESLLTIENNRSKEMFKRHVITQVDGLELFTLAIPRRMFFSQEEKDEQVYNDNITNSRLEIMDIISKYDTYGAKKDPIYPDIETYILKDQSFCGENHSSNHNYLVYNKQKMSLCVKCFSDRCQKRKFSKVLFKGCAPTLHFEASYFNNIPFSYDPLEENDSDVHESIKNSNYLECRRYFEHFFVNIRDTDSFYRINKSYSSKYSFWETELTPVKISGFRDFKYVRWDSEKGKKVSESFIKTYNNHDPRKNAYLGLSFMPFGTKSDKNLIENGNYNLFKGWNYNNVLKFKQKDNIPAQKQEDFNFLLNHILNYICGRARELRKTKSGMAKKMFQYLISWLANIIQRPTVVPHIIMVFFSKTHGTGKSGFTKFLSNVFGSDLSYFGSLDQIVEKHSTAHVGNIFNFIEEVSRDKTKKYHETIKDYCQRESAIYNEKMKQEQKIKTYVRYVMTTNNVDGAYFDKQDRRFCVYTFDKVHDKEYIKRLTAILEDPYITYMFGKYLEDYKIEGFERLIDWEEKRPLTADYFNMQSSDPVTEFLREFLTLNSFSIAKLAKDEYCKATDLSTFNRQSDIFICKDALYKLFTDFLKDNQTKSDEKIGKRNFYKKIQNIYGDFIEIDKNISARPQFDIKKNYFVIQLRELWHNIFDGKTEFVNHHNKLKQNDDAVPKVVVQEPVEVVEEVQINVEEDNSIDDLLGVPDFEEDEPQKNVENVFQCIDNVPPVMDFGPDPMMDMIEHREETKFEDSDDDDDGMDGLDFESDDDDDIV